MNTSEQCAASMEPIQRDQTTTLIIAYNPSQHHQVLYVVWKLSGIDSPDNLTHHHLASKSSEVVLSILPQHAGIR
jgi:hypothetical protein